MVFIQLVKNVINIKIGFIKFGLKTYFNSNGTSQGSNHELVDIFNIFKERDYNCKMISVSDIEYNKDEEVDIYFVFNGPITKYNLEGTEIFRNYTKPMVDILNNSNKKWLYFWTDPRKEYDIRDNPNITNKNYIILSQEKQFYSHLEKIIMYNKKPIQKQKENKLCIIMNDTNPKRTKECLKLNNLNFDIEVYGKWKTENKNLKEKLEESEVIKKLSTSKYSWNMATNKKWVSQKYYEMLLSGTLCFFQHYDEDNLILDKDDFRRIEDWFDIDIKIDKLNKNPELYNSLIKKQNEELKEEYYNGDFIYNIIVKQIYS